MLGDRPPTRWLVVIWVSATALGLLIAVTTSIGPVLISVTHEHGIHLGDLVGFAVVYAVALLWSAALRR